MKTAVEQLMIALYEGGYLTGNGNEMDDILEKYKEVFKQQLEKTFDYAVESEILGKKITAGEYYNEIYVSGVFIEENAKDELYDKPFVVCEDCGMEECICKTSSHVENRQSAVDWLLSELQIRLLTIKSEPNGIVRETMINNFLLDTEQAKLMETEQQQKIVDDALTNYELGWADRKKSSQTEISDEEIEKASNEGWVVLDSNRTDNWIRGAKWYREQLKKK